MPVSSIPRRLGVATTLTLMTALVPAAPPAIARADADRPSPAGARPTSQAADLLRPARARRTAATARPSSPSSRVRLTEVSHRLLPDRAAGQRIGLNLFDDADFTAVVDDAWRVRRRGTMPSYHVWSGHLADVRGGYWLAVRTGDGYLYHVGSTEGVYEISPAAGDTYQVGQVRQRDEGDDAVPAEEWSRHARTSRRLDQRSVVEPASALRDASSLGSSGQAPSGVETTQRGDDGSVIDVGFAYTPQAAAESAGAANLQAKMALAIAQTNQGYAQSGVSTRLNLVGVAATGDEIGSARVDLDAVTNPADGRYDEVHAWRNTVRADLVQLWTDGDEQSCGIAWLNGPQEQAFSVVDQQCATGNYTTGHELGHNQGLTHDHFVESQGAYPYGFGYVHVSGGASWRTVMAYVNQCQAAGVPPSYCPRLLYFSNPGVSYGGAPTGAGDADNARVLNETSARVASYRAGPTLTGTPRYGGTLTIVPGALPPGSAITGYQWYLNGQPVAGAVAPSVQVPLEWIGGGVSAAYTANVPGQPPLTEQTGAVAIGYGLVATTKPRLKAKRSKRKGRVLKVKMKPWAPVPAYKYKWFRGKSRIKGAKKRTYALTRRDRGKKIRVKVTGRLTGYEKAIVYSKRKKIRR